MVLGLNSVLSFVASESPEKDRAECIVALLPCAGPARALSPLGPH
jgi:hypothetical protein